MIGPAIILHSSMEAPLAAQRALRTPPQKSYGNILSAESDSVSSNSSLIISDGFTCSPLGSRHWHLKADVPTPMIGPSSSGREIAGTVTVANRRSFLYSDNTEHSRTFNEIDKIRGILVNYGGNRHKNELPKHFIDPFGSLRNLQV